MTQPLSSTDLAAIQLPNNPEKTADSTTANEETVSRPKTLKPTEREWVSNQAHLDTPREQIRHHKQECEQQKSDRKQECEQQKFDHKSVCGLLKQEIDELQLELAGRNEKIQGLVELCAELRTSAKLAGWLTITALVITSLGGIAVSLAGSPIDIPNEVKQPMAYGGGAAGICGLIMTLLSNCMIRSTSKPTAPDKTVNQLPTVKTKSTPN